nr:MAG TPA: hypothetical protein [Caudoviricetes sp.]
MSVEDLYRVLHEYTEVEIKLKSSTVWSGIAKYIPSSFFNKRVNVMYALNDTYDAFIRIEIDAD